MHNFQKFVLIINKHCTIFNILEMSQSKLKFLWLVSMMVSNSQKIILSPKGHILLIQDIVVLDTRYNRNDASVQCFSSVGSVLVVQ